jgi:hypothetical protein
MAGVGIAVKGRKDGALRMPSAPAEKVFSHGLAAKPSRSIPQDSLDVGRPDYGLVPTISGNECVDPLGAGS